MGKVYIYGKNTNYAFGISKENYIEDTNNEFILHPDLNKFESKIEDIQCAYSSTIIRCENGDCYGAGDNEKYNLGLIEQIIEEFTLIEFLKGKVKQHACGFNHSLFLTFDNEVYGCGPQYLFSQERTFNPPLFTKVSFGKTNLFKSISAGYLCTSFLTDKNTIICYGCENSNLSKKEKGQFGDNLMEFNPRLDIKDFGMYNKNEYIEMGVQVISSFESYAGIILCKEKLQKVYFNLVCVY